MHRTVIGLVIAGLGLFSDFPDTAVMARELLRLAPNVCHDTP